MTLFQTGSFSLNSGRESSFKIECDMLDEEDWATLARLTAHRLVPPFREAVGVPEGGFKFAEALNRYATEGSLLIADDVCTTGGSFGQFREKLPRDQNIRGVCAFATDRMAVPLWVRVVFLMRVHSPWDVPLDKVEDDGEDTVPTGRGDVPNPEGREDGGGASAGNVPGDAGAVEGVVGGAQEKDHEETPTAR